AVAPAARRTGRFSSSIRREPIPCSPIAFSMPAGVSTMRGAGCPSRAERKSPFETMAPSVDRSTTSAYSTPYPKQPLAASSGFFRVSEPIRTERSMSDARPQLELSTTEDAGDTEEKAFSCTGLDLRVLRVHRGGEFAESIHSH